MKKKKEFVAKIETLILRQIKMQQQWLVLIQKH